MATIKSQILEAIVTHPKDTITIKDVASRLPKGTNIQTVRVTVSKDLKNLGYIKPIKTGYGQGGALYQIIKRTIDDKVPPVKVVRKKNDMSFEDLGHAVFMRVKQLEEKVRDLSQGYSDIQSELKKEKEANRLELRSRDRRNVELLDENKKLRQSIKKLTKREGFSISELMGQ